MTEMMWLYIPLFIAGLVCLVKGSDFVTTHASAIAKASGISPLVVGMTIVAVSTSLPELAVSLISVFFRTSDIATGTIIGSNIANICLIVGLSALLYPVKTKSSFIKEGFFTLLFTLLIVVFLLDGMIYTEGIVILAGFFVYMYYLISEKRKGEIKKRTASGKRRTKKIIKHIFFSVAGGFVVVVGAEVVIHSTINIADVMGVSEMLIALIAIAVGTSLPELAVSFTAAWKKMGGISLGNILGSNIFNIAILAMVSLFSSVPVKPFTIFVNLPIMLISTALLMLFIRTGWEISRTEGGILIMIYLLFLISQFI